MGSPSNEPHVREIPVGEGAEWDAALASWDGRVDDGAARDAARKFEALAGALGRDANAYAWSARANYFVGDYIDGSGAAEFFDRGTELGRKAIEIDGNHIPALFWTSCCLGASAEHMSFLRRATVGPELVRSMGAVWEKDPTYFYRGVARFLGQAMVRQGGLVTKVLGAAMPDIGPDRVLSELQASIDGDPPYVLTHQTLAELAWQEKSDRDTVARMKQAIEEIDLDADPYLAPDNHRDQARARKVLAKIG